MRGKAERRSRASSLLIPHLFKGNLSSQAHGFGLGPGRVAGRGADWRDRTVRVRRALTWHVGERGFAALRQRTASSLDDKPAKQCL
jgi:hypothetical protein